MSYKGYLGCHSKVSKEDQEFYDLKNKAADYYRSNGVPEKIEGVLNEMFFQKPNDIYGYLANYFTRFSCTPVISKITGREVYDGRGLTAIQANVHCIIRDEEKMVCSAVMGGLYDSLSEGIAESRETVCNSDQQQLSVTTALNWIREHLSPMLQGFNPTDQTNLDKLLSDFFMARYLEDKKRCETEQEENKSETVSEAPAQAPPAPASNKDKKGGDKGKKGNSTEKPLPPAEPPVPRLPGAIAVGVVSLAVAKTATRLIGAPLYTHITSIRVQQASNKIYLPMPMITILSCGKNSLGKLNLLDEVILLPTSSQRVRQVIGLSLELHREMRRILNGSGCKAGPVGISEEGSLQVGFERPEQALDLVTEACANLKLPLGSDLRLAINCAAQCLMDYSRGRYEVMSGCHKSPDELVDLYEGLIHKYPSITALIDPFRKEDVEQWERLASVIGQSCCLIADEGSNPCPQWGDAKPLPQGVTRVIFRHHGDMTISELIRRFADKSDTETILAAGSAETGDTSIVDLAVGLGSFFLKMGGLRGGERMDKYNRLMAIEQELEQEGILGAREINLVKPAAVTS
ncbi:enolase 4 isoform X2 [Triplophysa rosa]|uniref:enolase 4 isoform X2 n=1 Tax=Triplophysa rosa TaxID=992332 RepID=UPI0025460DF2|nr:enolase 4 isoform X2 [Triplophysa rosa]